MNLVEAEGGAGETQHEEGISGKTIQTSLPILEITEDEVMEVREDRATTLVLRQGPRVSRSEV